MNNASHTDSSKTSSDSRENRKGTALVTGASGGIGADLAILLAKDGYDLVLTARSAEKLDALGEELTKQLGVRCVTIVADLSAARGPKEIVDALAARGLEIDVLVNNAGYGLYGPFVETSLDAEIQMIQLNVASLTHLTKAILPGMIARQAGKILNVASTAAFQPGPLMAVYYATKAYVLSFSEALSNELDGTGVTVTALCPGPTRTGFQAGAKMEESKLVRGKIMDSQTVARVGYEALMKGKRVVIPGVMNKLMAQSVRFLPRGVVTGLVRSAQEREGS
jgi:uncharacterized protein